MPQFATCAVLLQCYLWLGGIAEDMEEMFIVPFYKCSPMKLLLKKDFFRLNVPNSAVF